MFLCEYKTKILESPEPITADDISYKMIAWKNSVAKSYYLCKYMNRGDSFNIISKQKIKNASIMSYINGCKSSNIEDTQSIAKDLYVLINKVYKLNIYDIIKNNKLIQSSSVKSVICNNKPLKRGIGNFKNNPNNVCKNINEYIADKSKYKGSDKNFENYLLGIINEHDNLITEVFFNQNTNKTNFLHQNENISLIRQIEELKMLKKPSFMSKVFRRLVGKGKRKTRKHNKRNTRKTRKPIKLKRRLSKHRFSNYNSIH
jgi:hypothetical protein